LNHSNIQAETFLMASDERDESASPAGQPIGAVMGPDHETTSVPIPPGPLDLQTCFELAVLRSETLGLKEEDIRIAQARYWQAIGSVLPMVHVLASETLQNNPGSFSSGSATTSTDVMDGGTSGGNQKDRFTSRLNVKQPIFSGFRESSTAAAYEATIEAQKHLKRRNLQLLYLDVADVFYQILMYEDDIRLLGDIRSALKERVAELEKRVRLGKSRSGELLMAKSELADSLVTIEHVRGLLDASSELMSFLTGIRPSPFKLKDAQTLPSTEALEFYLSRTGERPDILAAIQNERSAHRQLSATKGEHWPTISAEGNYYLHENPVSRREWNILLTVDLPLFEGGLIEARVSERKAQVRSSQLSLEQLRRTADRDVRTAYSNFLASAAQMARLQEAEKVADENCRVQTEDYKLGVASNLDVLDAMKQLYDTRRRLLGMDMDTRVDLIRLHVSAGMIQK